MHRRGAKGAEEEQYLGVSNGKTNPETALEVKGKIKNPNNFSGFLLLSAFSALSAVNLFETFLNPLSLSKCNHNRAQQLETTMSEFFENNRHFVCTRLDCDGCVGLFPVYAGNRPKRARGNRTLPAR